MRYVLAEIDKAVANGFDLNHHRHNDNYVLLNEREVTSLGHSFEEGCEMLGGKPLTGNRAHLLTKTKGAYKL